MSEVIRSANIKTRTIHRCWGCMVEIPIGSLVDSQTFSDMGKITTAYFCDICAEILNENDDGCCYGDFQEEAGERRAALTAPEPGEKEVGA